jgi:tetratricopeptide (TPR) repeat protein
METLREQVSLHSLLDVFESDIPNSYHVLIARLVKRECVTTVVTTNYDTLIEQALGREGLQENRDYFVYRSLKALKGVDWTDKRPRLLKLHGCITDRENVYATLSRVADRRNAAALRPTLRQVFNKNVHNWVTIIGYSCSDKFDISPTLELMRSGTSDVVLFDYEDLPPSKWRVETLSKKVEPNPFRGWPSGSLIVGKTDSLLKGVWRQQAELLGTCPRRSRIDEQRWKNAVRAWAVSEGIVKSAALRTHLIGRLLMRGARYAEARRAFETSLRHATRARERELRVQAQLNLGICLYRLSEFRNSVRIQRKALQGAQRLRLVRLEGQSLGNLGNVHWSQSKLTVALKYQKLALNLARRNSMVALEANTLGNIGIIWEKRKRFDLARRYHRMAERLAFRIGDAVGQARHRFNIGLTYALEKKNKLALNALSLAQHRAEHASQQDIISACLHERGAVLARSGRLAAERVLRDAISLAQITGERLRLLECYESLADFYGKNGRTAEAVRIIEAAESTARAAKDVRAQRLFANLRVTLGV